MLFDFSLSRAPPENIQAGTRPYLDPFLADRRPPRWDLHAERYAAAITLHEMLAGAPPVFGDGLTEPSVTDVPGAARLASNPPGGLCLADLRSITARRPARWGACGGASGGMNGR
jgi:hypothetical protein